MCIIEADIALESWLFRLWPCSGQGQFTLSIKFVCEGGDVLQLDIYPTMLKNNAILSQNLPSSPT